MGAAVSFFLLQTSGVATYFLTLNKISRYLVGKINIYDDKKGSPDKVHYQSDSEQCSQLYLKQHSEPLLLVILFFYVWFVFCPCARQ